MKKFVKKAIFGVLGMVLLCLPATAWAVPLDADVLVTETIPPQTQALEAPRMSRDVADINKELLVSIGHDTAKLEPNAPYEIFLDNTSLGTYTSDPNGQLFVQVVLPPNTQPGSHGLTVKDAQVTLTKFVTLTTVD